jgi:DNA-binding NtrC family response regulator
MPKSKALNFVLARHIYRILNHFHGDMQKACESLGLTEPRQLTRKCERYGITSDHTGISWDWDRMKDLAENVQP